MGMVLSDPAAMPCPPKSRHGVPAELVFPQREPKMRWGEMD